MRKLMLKDPGIKKMKKEKGYIYLLENHRVKEKEAIESIQKLVIPPAWTDVWISASARGHIQATGLDARKRKQYRYHSNWNSLRNMTKFHRMYEFGNILPSLRGKIS
jgi:DNA topoisomerase I